MFLFRRADSPILCCQSVCRRWPTMAFCQNPHSSRNERTSSMNVVRDLRSTALALAVCLAGAGALAQQPATATPAEYQPSVFQEGKDVVWVPTSQTLAERMLDLAKVTSRDYVIDLGSGDGRTVITAAKRGAQA